ncbi:MAG: phosphoenolpyruvate carboxylase [Sphingobacteriia bacterium]|nr:MAG: phosphoenolpyruvate carboxylase [Sphingobacteriia bacterium]TAH08034.1 MAG: phosphoenolpyruvate carboxylase [Sphingobacteriia bacterium]
MNNSSSLQQFRQNVTDKYTIFNSLFAALPYSGIANVGALLPILLQSCVEGYQEGKDPMQIIDLFFSRHTGVVSETDKVDRLFKFVQYIERQVVLFDAIEDAAFSSVNDLNGTGSLKALYNEAFFKGKIPLLKEKLQHFKVRVVLTAHPTQFYPGSVLGIIHDLGEAIGKNDFQTINLYIQQLGITPFFNKKQPTPLDEAVNLMWYLENILYQSIGNIYNFIQQDILAGEENNNPFIELGFWPGGDRDGNPFVNAATTLKVAASLRSAIIVCYYRDIRKLKRRLTFAGVDVLISQLEELLYENVFRPNENKRIQQTELLQKLEAIKVLMNEQHHGLYIKRLDSLMNKVRLFGTWFASLDIRQDSRIHTKVLADINATRIDQKKGGILPDNYTTLSEGGKINCLLAIDTVVELNNVSEEISKDTLESIFAINSIQQTNGEAGCHRYIISNCQSALNVIEVFTLFKLCGWDTNQLSVDIVPLFETIDDLKAAEGIMEFLYQLPIYQKHIAKRQKSQTIMLGFSDGTKDGGYLQANWSIYTAKEQLTSISRKYGIKVKFFDGRGGPPSRGGGKTNKFYASLGNQIENEEIQLTIQGQTITSNFGTLQSAQYNLEQLLSAGISNTVFAENRTNLTESERALLTELGAVSHHVYQNFKAHPQFMTYMQQFSPLNYYSKSNIASRPGKRGNADKLRFEDLRAIPFVGSWSQLKQNVPGYFGVGSALKQLKEAGRWEEIKALFNNVLFFRTLIDNSMMSMLKSFFPLTAYIKDNAEYGEIWQLIKTEFDITEQLVLELSGNKCLMEEDQSGRNSILMRDKIVLPLLTIQQYALHQLNNKQLNENQRKDYEKLVTRSMFGIINAARNSA